MKKYVAELPGSHWGRSIGSQDAWLLPGYQIYVAKLPGSHWGQSIGSQDAWLLPSFQNICSQAAGLSRNM
jgi:hypothetical protein